MGPRTRAFLLVLTSVYSLFSFYKFTSHSHLNSDLNILLMIHETDLSVLTDTNFSDFIDKNRHAIVMFYAPCCYHSIIQTQVLLLTSAAKSLNDSDVAFAAVNVSAESDLRSKYRLPLYPTIHFFVDGVSKYIYDFDQVMTSDAMLTWVKRKVATGVYNLTSLNQDAVTIHISEPKFVFGFLDSLEGSYSEELAAASLLHSDVDFYQTASVDVATFFRIDPKINRPALFFRLPGLQHRFDGQFTRSAIAEFVARRKNPPVITFTAKYTKSILNNPLKQLWLFSSYNCSQVLCMFEEVAEVYRGKILFVQVLYKDNDSTLEQIYLEFGISEDLPKVVAYDSRNSTKFAFRGELTLNNIKSFAEDFLNDESLSQMDAPSETDL